jgi:hypothetical protein
MARGEFESLDGRALAPSALVNELRLTREHELYEIAQARVRRDQDEPLAKVDGRRLSGNTIRAPKFRQLVVVLGHGDVRHIAELR